MTTGRPGAVVGTADHLDHLILPNLEFFMPSIDRPKNVTVYSEAQKLFERSAFGGPYTTLPGTDITEANKYWEATIHANPRLTDVKFVVADFASLFGTYNGRKLQTVSANYDWPLVWSFGSGGHAPLPPDPSPGNRRILDPLYPITNASRTDETRDEFEEVWSLLETARRTSWSDGKAMNFEQYWNLLISQTRVAPITARSCGTTNKCIGTNTASGDCICISNLKAERHKAFAPMGRMHAFVTWSLMRASEIHLVRDILTFAYRTIFPVINFQNSR